MADDQWPSARRGCRGALGIVHWTFPGHWPLVLGHSLPPFLARPAEKEKRQARACLSMDINRQLVAYSGWAEMWPGLG